MKEKYFLPNHYKKAGALMMPIGLIIWSLTQIGLVHTLITIHWINVMVLTISFFSFLIGMYFISFSKEKFEDEYIDNLRLHSFQLSALIQLIFFVLSFLYMFIFKAEPSRDGGLELFLIISIFIFWLFYILHFNFSLFRNKKKIYEE